MQPGYLLFAALLTGCSPSQEAYSAVHQVISDPLMFYLGNHYYLAKERDGAFMLIQLDQNYEVAEIKKLF